MTTKYILEDYCSEEIRSLLEENGYIGSTNTYLDKDGYRVKEITLQSAMKWLREVHHYYIQVMLDSWAYGGHMGYYVIIQKTNSEFEIMLSDKIDKVFYDEPEEACEEAIKYCLENLI